MTVRNSFSSVGGWAASLNTPTLPWALGEPALQSTPGFPRTVAQRASASKLFAVLNNVKGIGRDDLGALLERMFRNPLKDGWFNARTEDARSIRDEFSRLLGGALVLDVRSVKWRGQERVEKCSGTVPSANCVFWSNSPRVLPANLPPVPISKQPPLMVQWRQL